VGSAILKPQATRARSGASLDTLRTRLRAATASRSVAPRSTVHSAPTGPAAVTALTLEQY